LPLRAGKSVPVWYTACPVATSSMQAAVAIQMRIGMEIPLLRPLVPLATGLSPLR
jgi:hypothetical protein